MIAHLPLLFANGQPVALADLAGDDLEKFITFMVTCSWGRDTVRDIRQPPWWPRDVRFSHPFVRPAVLPKNWEARLRNVVRKCYDYHQSQFLIVFSSQLARMRTKLRYVDNLDTTTSLYLKTTGKLLVTFRNENLHYDSPKPIVVDLDDEEEKTDISSKVEEGEEPMINTILVEDEVVTVKPADIYLCDNCDSHFDNLEIYNAHERLCNSDIPTSSCNGGLPDFLSALKLLPVGETPKDSTSVDPESESRLKFVRSAANVDRGPLYPFSSLAYTRSIKANVQRDTSYSRERVERYCCNTALSKIVVNKTKNQQFPIRYRRPIDYWHRKHVFLDQRKKKILDLKAQLLLLKCRPISVDVDRMSNESMQEYMENLKKEAEIKAQYLEDKDIVYVDGLENDQPVDEEMKSLDPLKRSDSDCEVIDLCSDDDSPGANENCDPQAGITCVMRGGAVLRRTAATPQALPSEPCGARDRPMPVAILQPHPVILIAHTLNNLQTISID